MCGRFSLATPPDVLAQQFEIPEVPELEPRYNIAPTQDVPIVRVTDGAAPREMVLVRWGLVPWWADDPSIGNRLINARAETAATTPAYRDAFSERRCLVVADGFYEWRKENGRKQPYFIRLRSGGPMGFAGLWDRWRDKVKGDKLQSCTIVTTNASPTIRELHDRMPVIVPPVDYDRWLDPTVHLRSRLKDILQPYPEGELEAFPVSTRVNRPENEGPENVEPVGPKL
jgi:putative SOS response-associated peptidase YedK